MGRPNKYPDQFRKDALELVKTSERPIAEVARSLVRMSSRIGPSVLGRVPVVRRWRVVRSR